MSDHTPECVAAREGHFDQDGRPDLWPIIADLDNAGRAAVLACPHWAHDAARAMFRVDGGAP